MSKRTYYVTFVLVLLATGLLLNLPDRITSRIRIAVGLLYLPLFGLAGSMRSAVDQAQQAVASRPLLQQEIQTLRRENEQLQLQLSQLKEAWIENARLRRALEWLPRAPWRLRTARVVGQDPANWWLGLHIDVGTRNGVRLDSPVLAAEGLIGKIAETGYAQSRVVLLGDPACRVAAQVQETRDKGIITPNAASLDRSLVDLAYLPFQAAVKPGQTVITSGDGGIFPKGIPVGQVVHVTTNELGLYLEAKVRVAANLARLEEVFVMNP